MQPAAAGDSRHFHWDLVTPDQLGSLLYGVEAPKLQYTDELIVAAATVLARSGGGDLYFVGHAPDSLFDLLSGALHGTEQASRLHRLAFGAQLHLADGQVHPDDSQVEPARDVLRDCGITPQALARSHRPVALADLVSQGNTFGSLFRVLRDWIEAEREPWPVIRRKLHFIGVSARRKPGQEAHRWQQDADWPAELPARAVVDVPMDPFTWSYLGNDQVKLVRSEHPEQWTAADRDGSNGSNDSNGSNGRGGEDRRREALAEAVALVELGRRQSTRSLLARTMAAEPAYAESWLRTLVRQLA